jgi:hypothetical protein
MLYAFAAVLIAVTGVLAYALTWPDHFRLERSTVIAAPPETIRPLIADFRAWRDWSPWEGKDPAMKRNLTGAAAGVGAVYGWEGNGQVGTGRMEIVEDAPRRVAIKLDFLKPFEAHNLTEFTLAPEGARTRVTWAMSGPQPFIAKLMSVVFSMERIVGPDFEAGLAALKRRAEG